jgi:hypothetical protein
MLDVHPPHHPTHTWRDFFIHIATIVVGLIIAVGLEQAVEYVHHRNEIIETREALRLERDQNRTRMAEYVANFRWESAVLKNDMLVLISLQQHPGTPAGKLPGVLVWSMRRAQFAHAAWDTAQQAGVLALMPHDEVTTDQTLYHALDDISNANEDEWHALNEADRFLFRNPDPSQFTPAQIHDEIDLTEKVMVKHFLQGNFMGYPAVLNAAFPPGPTNEELAGFHGPTGIGTLASTTSGPGALTFQRAVAAGYQPPPARTTGPLSRPK